MTNESSLAGPVLSTPNPANDNEQQLQRTRMPVQSARFSHHDLDAVQRMGRLLAASQYFADARDLAQAAVKIMAGQELGIPPIAAMMGIHVIKGKIVLSGNLIASRIRAHGYDFRHKRFDGTGCVLEFLGKLEAGKRTVLGESAFTEEDARAAGCYGDMYRKFPRNMYFNRALSNGAKWYTPEVFAGAPVYVAEELGARVDENGDMIGATVIPMQPPVKAEAPAAPVVAIIEALPEFEYEETEPPSMEEQLEISIEAENRRIADRQKAEDAARAEKAKFAMLKEFASLKKRYRAINMEQTYYAILGIFGVRHSNEFATTDDGLADARACFRKMLGDLQTRERRAV